MTNRKLKIGFIGLGKMGAGICANIQKAGYELIVYNRTISKTQIFEERGARVAHTVKEIVENCDIFFTSLMDDRSILEMCHGEDGILNCMSPQTIHVGLTTIQPSTSDILKTLHEKHDCHYIAAPVVGRPDAAASGKLITFLAGDSGAIDIVTPIINSYTVKKVLTGNIASSASAMKICINYMAMAQLSLLGEVFTYAEKSKLEQNQILAVVKLFFFGNEAMIDYATKIAFRDFDKAGFDLTAGLKDALIFENAFTAVGVKPGSISVAKENLVSANANGLGEKDWSALTEITRMLAGLD